jgi:hypothetical protein
MAAVPHVTGTEDMKRSRIVLPVVLALLASWSSSGHGDKTVLTPSEVALVTAPDTSESRLLVRFEPSGLADEDEVYYAEISFHVPGIKALQEVELYELESSWTEASVTWRDFEGDSEDSRRRNRIGCWITDDKTGDLVKFVVTRPLSMIMAGLEPNNGFAIKAVEQGPLNLKAPMEQLVLTIHSGPRLSRERAAR